MRPAVTQWLMVACFAFGCTTVTKASRRLVIRSSNSTGHQQSVGVGVQGNSSNARPPRIYFLFLAVDKVSNLDVWLAFFRQAPVDQYRAFVHCKLPSCTSMVAGTPLVPVQTVPSYYCTDLVSPMNQLLSYALSADVGSSHFADKFAFVSDSTLPAKPFREMYATLSARRGSDFCVFPVHEWADLPGVGGGLEVAVKHHQWITLERFHAESALALWRNGMMHDFMSRFHMNHMQYNQNNNTFADNRNFGCLDEFWHMAALYGTLKHGGASQVSHVELSMFSGTPLQISATTGWQGECDTFVVWSKYLHLLGHNPFEKFYSSLDYESIPHGGNWARPGWWDTISSAGIMAIRKSSFLFVRKFIDSPRLTDGVSFSETYAHLVFNV